MKSYKAKETLQLGLSKRYTVTLHTGHIVTVLLFYLIFLYSKGKVRPEFKNRQMVILCFVVTGC